MNWYHAILATFLVVVGVLIFYAGFRIGEQAGRGGTLYTTTTQRANRPVSGGGDPPGPIASEVRTETGSGETRAVFVNERGVTTGAPVLESAFSVERDTRRFVSRAKPTHIINAIFAPRQYADRQWRIAAAATSENAVDRRVNVLWRRYRRNSGVYYWQPTIISEAESNSWILRLVDGRSGDDGSGRSRNPAPDSGNVNNGSLILRDEDVVRRDPPGPRRTVRRGLTQPPGPRRTTRRSARGENEFVEYDAYGERIVRRRGTDDAGTSRSGPLSSGTNVR